MSFTRVKEDFTCDHCRAIVKGTGYTNHCPKCLWSKHVDVHPGDRAAICSGMLEPVGVEGTADLYRIVHRCRECGSIRKNKAAIDDDMNTILRLGGRPPHESGVTSG